MRPTDSRPPDIKWLAQAALPLIAAVAIVTGVRVAAAAQAPGTPDRGFAEEGVATWTRAVGQPAAGTDVAVDAQGRIVVAGYAADTDGVEDFAVLRYLPDGRLDPSFGAEGVVTTPVGASHGRATALAIAPDGKILVSGIARNPVGSPPHRAVFAVARYLPDGSLDPGFGSQGTALTLLPGDSYAHGMALQSDGKLVVAGVTTSAATGPDPCVIRYQSNGAIDTGFGTGGVSTMTINGDQEITGVALTSSGRILLVGRVPSAGGLLVRLRPDGTPDDTFGSWGLAAGGAMWAHNRPVIQPDGKIVVPGGLLGNPGGGYVAVTRHHATGSIDSSFAGDGTANSFYDGEAFDAAVQPDGKIVVAGLGRTLPGDIWSRFLWRLNPDGTPDAGFQAQVPVADPDPGSGLVRLAAVTLQPDGKIVAAGSGGDPPWAIQAARYHGDLPEVIFTDGFESGDLARWSAAATGEGDLAVSTEAALEDTTFGLRATVEDTAGLYVQDDTPDDESRYRARFHFDPNGFDPGEAAGHRRTRLFIAFADEPLRRVIAVVLRRLGGSYAVMARVRQDDDSQVNTPFIPLSDAPHAIELDWRRASAPDAADGALELWIDGASLATLAGLDNSDGVEFVRLGALSVKSGASGTLHWDEFESRRESYIGP
jgi:uncharacterized delta-60 repeat protein